MLAIESIHHIELYVTNARHTAYFYKSALGFERVAYGDDSTGIKNKISYILKQGDIYMILTSPIKPPSKIQNFLNKHGDGIKEISFYMNDINTVYSYLNKKGIDFISKLQCYNTVDGTKLMKFSIKSCGDVIHSFVSYAKKKQGYFPFLEKYKILKKQYNDKPLITSIDHIAFCGPVGFIEKISQYYCDNLDFIVSRKEVIDVETSGMKTAVLESKNGYIKFPIVEPLSESQNSDLDNFLIFNNGEGVHHVAFYTDDIVKIVNKTKKKGVEYMDNAPKKSINTIKTSSNSCINNSLKLKEIQENNILYEINDDGYLLQIFSKPTQPRPTFFFELIERHNNEGFGTKNIKSLYKQLITE